MWPEILFCIIAIALYLYSKYREYRPKVDLQKKEKIVSNLDKISGLNTGGGVQFGSSQKNRLAKSETTQSSVDDEGHILCVGGSGLGKTSALLIPTLRSWAETIGTFLVWDISGDIHPKVKAPKSLLYEPANPNSIPYNIFGIIDRKKTVKAKNKELAKLALLLLPEDPTASEASRYYTREGRKIMTAALIAYYYQGLDFIEICEKINFLSWRNLLNEIDASQNKDAIRYINSFEGIPDQYSASAKQSCEDAINLFATDEDIKATVRRPSEGESYLDPTRLEKNNIFIVMDDSDLELYSSLSQIIASQCLDFIAKRPLDHEQPILLCMDEAASLGQINILPALRKFRKRHCRIFMLTQSLADIDLTWGTYQRKAMMTNFKYKVVLESSEPDEQEYWSRLAGKKWIWHESSISRKGDNKTYTDAITHENNIEPHEFANLGDNLILFYPGGFEKLTKAFYFKSKNNYDSYRDTTDYSKVDVLGSLGLTEEDLY